jgi:hypothetical protein
MKNLFLISLFIPFLSVHAAAMKPDVFKNTLERLYAEQSEKIQQCNNQNKSLIKKAYTEVEKPTNEEAVKFVEDEKKALEYIESIDLNKIFSATEEDSENLFFTNCSERNIKIYEELNKSRELCGNYGDELDFMRGLIYATKNYAWSPETKEKAKKLLLNYVDQASSEHNRPLTQRTIAASVLSTMLQYNLIDSSYAEAVKKIKGLPDQQVPKKKKTAADLKPCAVVVEKRKAEVSISNEMAKEMQLLLKKINHPTASEANSPSTGK